MRSNIHGQLRYLTRLREKQTRQNSMVPRVRLRDLDCTIIHCVTLFSSENYSSVYGPKVCLSILSRAGQNETAPSLTAPCSVSRRAFRSVSCLSFHGQKRSTQRRRQTGLMQSLSPASCDPWLNQRLSAGKRC